MLMNPYDYTEIPANLNSLAVSRKLEALHGHDTLEDAIAQMQPAAREQRREDALAQSALAAASLAGEALEEERLRALMEGKLPSGPAEAAATGHVYVLDLIENRHTSMAVSPGVIMQLHRDFHFFGSEKHAGVWRSPQDDQDTDPAVPSDEISWHMRQLCRAHNTSMTSGKVDPLLLAAMFTCDFLRISPFPATNERLSCLLFQELVLKAGWGFISYGCIEASILATSNAWEASLSDSKRGWPQGGDYLPFVEYLLDVLAAPGVVRAAQPAVAPAANAPAATKPAPPRTQAPAPSATAAAKPAPKPADATASQAAPKKAVPVVHVSKPRSTATNEAIIRAYFATVHEPVTKAQIMQDNPSMSQKTIERNLQKLQREGVIERVGAARATKYRHV